jgi:hypothetical protein
MKNPFYRRVRCDGVKSPWYMGLSYRLYDPDEYMLVAMPFNVLTAIVRNMFISLRRNFEIPMCPKDAYWQGFQNGKKEGFDEGVLAGRKDGMIDARKQMALEKDDEQGTK